jgi:hypothetical protein
MHAVWNGYAATPTSTSATRYAHVCNTELRTWRDFEWTPGFGEAAAPLSDAITVTKLTAYVTTAPGSGKSWTFKLRVAQADSSASVTISDAATSATWSGSVSVAQLDLVAISCTPSGTPTAAGRVFWTIEYDSVGSDYYLLPFLGVGTQALSIYSNPFGAASPASGTATDFEAVIPHSCTVTKVAGATAQTVPNGDTYTYTVRKNNTTNSSFTAVFTGPDKKAVSSAGTLTFVGGDTIAVNSVGGGTNPPWSDRFGCLTVVPDTIGEVAIGFGNLQALSTTATEFESGMCVGLNAAWNTTEANVHMRVAGGTLKKLYVKLVTATGAGNTRDFTLRSNLADTAVVASLLNTATGNDTANTASHADGDFVSIKMVPTSSPNATNGAKLGFVLLVTQPGTALVPRNRPNYGALLQL